MNSRIQDTVRRLMELHTLEERLGVFGPKEEKAAEVQAGIAALRARLPATALAHHDRLRGRGKRSVAEVRRGVCCGCHLGVASGLLAEVRRVGALHKCDNCGRFLYLVEEEEDEPELKKPAVKRQLAAVMA